MLLPAQRAELLIYLSNETGLRGQVVQNMSTWASTTQESWVSYHITREQMGDAILKELEKAQVETCLPLI